MVRLSGPFFSGVTNYEKGLHFITYAKKKWRSIHCWGVWGSRPENICILSSLEAGEGGFSLCYVMLCYVMLCYVMLCYVMLCYVMLCYVMLCYVMLCYVMLCYVMLCYVMLCYVMLCYVMLCYVIQLTPHWGFSVADYIKYCAYLN